MLVLNFFLVAIVFGPVTSISLNAKEFPFLKTQLNDEKHATTFNKLLNSIVKTNQKRLDAINKLTKLQATDVYPSLQDGLRASRRESDEDSDESREHIIYLVIPDTPDRTEQNFQRAEKSPSTERPRQPIQPERTQNVPTVQDYSKLKALDPSTLNEAPSTTSQSSIQTISKEGLDSLRINIERSCKSKEGKRCTQACRAAVKSACEEYSCKKKLKKKLRKSCKRECKEEFSNGW